MANLSAEPCTDDNGSQSQEVTPSISITTDNLLAPALQSFNPATGQLPDMLTGYQTPQATITPIHKLSALHIRSPDQNKGTLLQPLPQKDATAHEADEEDYEKLISAFNTALTKACQAGRELQRVCQNKEQGESEREDCSLKELRDYKEKCSELTEYEKHLKEAYEREYHELKKCIAEKEVEQKESDRDHRIEVDRMEQRHQEETKVLKEKFVMQVEHQKLQNLRFEQSKILELNRLKDSYKADFDQVEKLRSKLAGKEKSLYELGSRIRVLQVELEKQSLITDRNHMQQQLQRCEEIGKMVACLPNVRKKEMDKLVAEIFEEVGKMKEDKTKRSISWRQ